MIRTRFAPSPTGLLHVGNIRTALINWLFARKHKGEFLLRIDDTDTTRSNPIYTEGIKQDLSWLGMDWDLYCHQKDRMAKYEEIKKFLINKGLLYACYETPEELAIKRKIQLSQSKPPIYDRASLKFTREKIEQYKQEGRRPHFRFKLSDKPIEWNDLVRGTVKYESISMSDPILIREDGSWTYMLCSVIDDIDFKISHIIRGEDHVSNTAIHIQLFESLEANPPLFAHLPRITSKASELSKRKGGFDIKSLREVLEIEAMTINNYLAKIGTSEPPSSYISLVPLINEFDIKKFHKSPTNYEQSDLIKLNHKLLSELSFQQVQPRIKDLNIGGEITPTFWATVKYNIERLSDIKLWYNICCQTLTPEIEEKDKEFLEESAKLLPEGEWDNNTWDIWVNTLKNKTNRKGKELFMPIRKALSSLSHGPELKFLLPLIGKTKATKRLNGETA